MESRLLELRLFVDDVLSYDGIVLLELKLVGRVRAVLRGRVKMPRSRRRLELDLLALSLGHRFDSLLPKRERFGLSVRVFYARTVLLQRRRGSANDWPISQFRDRAWV